MCGIWYLRHHKPETLTKALKLQIDRGTDAYGYIGENIVNKMTTIALTKENFAEDCTARTAIPEGGWVAWHTRKSSIGAKDVNNAHPHKINEWIIMQNGTEKAFVEWWKVWFLDEFVSTASDTNYMLEYLIAKTKSGMQLDDIIDKMIWTALVVWAVFVYNEETDELIFMSDGTRDSYIEKDDQGNILSISSEAINIENQYDKNKKRKYSNIWYIHFKPKTGKIIAEHIEAKNFNKDWGLVKTTNYTNSYYSSSYGFTGTGVGVSTSGYSKTDEDKWMVLLSKKQIFNIITVMKEAYGVGVPDNLLEEMKGETRSKYLILWVAWELHNFIKRWEDKFKIFFMKPKLFKVAVDVAEHAGKEYLHSTLLSYL